MLHRRTNNFPLSKRVKDYLNVMGCVDEASYLVQVGH